MAEKRKFRIALLDDLFEPESGISTSDFEGHFVAPSSGLIVQIVLEIVAVESLAERQCRKITTSSYPR